LSASEILNVVVPMAGRGSRFVTAGYTTPKPLLSLGGQPMVEWVVDNVRPQRPHRFIFLCLADHLHQYPDIPNVLKDICPGCTIIPVDVVTEGAACTVLLARELIDSESPLMIANSDQYVSLDINDYLAVADRTAADGLIMTFWSDHPKWSYCRLGSDGKVLEVVEKQVVSNEATVGVYNFRKGRDFVRAADRMITLDFRVNGEFYVAPVYNVLIKEGHSIVVARTGRERDGMYGLGIPEDFEFFKTTDLFRRRAIAPQP
jgi:NDP-sugar pyrophosphorylase family protein